jgi:hypothetical protein
VLLPCDLAPPRSLNLTSVLDKHRQSPQAVLTAVFYEPVESVKEGEFFAFQCAASAYVSWREAHCGHGQELVRASPSSTSRRKRGRCDSTHSTHPKVGLVRFGRLLTVDIHPSPSLLDCRTHISTCLGGRSWTCWPPEGPRILTHSENRSFHGYSRLLGKRDLPKDTRQVSQISLPSLSNAKPQFSIRQGVIPSLRLLRDLR